MTSCQITKSPATLQLKRSPEKTFIETSQVPIFYTYKSIDIGLYITRRVLTFPTSPCGHHRFCLWDLHLQKNILSFQGSIAHVHCPFSSPDRNQPESPATPRHTSEAKASAVSPYCRRLFFLYNINQYIPTHFQFLRSFEPKRPNIALQGTFEAVDGNLESQSMYPWDKNVICMEGDLLALYFFHLRRCIFQSSEVTFRTSICFLISA